MTTFRAHDALFATVLALSAAAYLATAAVTLDDAFIYLRVAERFAATGRPTFNDGDAALICTGPLWLLVLTAARLALPWADLAAVAHGLFVALLAVAAVLLRRIAAPTLPGVAALAPLPVFFAPSMATLAGHDTALALAACLWTVACWRRRAYAWFPVAAAVAYLARGESAVLAAVLAVVWLVEDRCAGMPVRAMLRLAGRGIVAAAVLVGAWHLYHLAAFGALLPQTLAVKLAQGRGGWVTFGHSLQLHLTLFLWPKVHWPIVVCAWGFLVVAWRLPVLLLWSGLHFALFALLGIAWYHWYYYPIELAVAVCFVAGAVSIAAVALVAAGRAVGRLPAVAAPVLGGALAVAIVQPFHTALAVRALGAVAQIRDTGTWPAAPHDPRFDLYVRLAEAISAIARPGDPRRLLSFEVGILGRLLPDYTVEDVVGLATPRPAGQLWHYGGAVAADPPAWLLHTVRQPEGITFATADGGTADYRWVAVEAPAVAAHLYRRADVGDPRIASLFALAARPVAVSLPLSRVAGPDGPVLLAHAPSGLRLDIPAGARRLAIAFGLPAGAYSSGGATDGVDFAVSAVAPDGAQRVLWRRTLDPVGAVEDRGIQSAVVDLDAAPPRSHLVLSTGPRDDPRWDWSFWAGAAFDPP